MKTNRTTFAFSDREKEMLNNLCKAMGCNPSELFRSLIRDRYLKIFPPYKNNVNNPLIPKEELTDQQICEMIAPGAKVEKDNNGNLICIIPGAHPGIKTTIPLSMAAEEYQEVHGKKNKK